MGTRYRFVAGPFRVQLRPTLVRGSNEWKKQRVVECACVYAQHADKEEIVSNQ